MRPTASAASPPDFMPAPVYIESDGGAECVQVDFTPLGAYRFFGGAVVDLAARMIEIDDVLGHEGCAAARAPRRHRRLAAPLRYRRGFCRRSRQPSAVARARIRLSPDGAQRRRHPDRRAGAGDRLEPQAPGRSLSIRIRSRPQTAGAHACASIRACRLARTGTSSGWAGIAADSGFSDQAHLVREFAALAGEPPTAWARRLALTDSRLTRPQDKRFPSG